MSSSSSRKSGGGGKVPSNRKRPNNNSTPEPDEGEFTIERILGKRLLEGSADQYEYRIKWFGWEKEEDITWQAEDTLQSIKYWLDEFNRAEALKEELEGLKGSIAIAAVAEVTAAETQTEMVNEPDLDSNATPADQEESEEVQALKHDIETRERMIIQLKSDLDAAKAGQGLAADKLGKKKKKKELKNAKNNVSGKDHRIREVEEKLAIAQKVNFDMNSKLRQALDEWKTGRDKDMKVLMKAQDRMKELLQEAENNPWLNCTSKSDAKSATNSSVTVSTISSDNSEPKSIQAEEVANDQVMDSTGSAIMENAAVDERPETGIPTGPRSHIDAVAAKEKLTKENNFLKSKLEDKDKKIEELEAELKTVKGDRAQMETKLTLGANELKELIKERDQAKKDLEANEEKCIVLGIKQKELLQEKEQLVKSLAEKDEEVKYMKASNDYQTMSTEQERQWVDIFTVEQVELAKELVETKKSLFTLEEEMKGLRITNQLQQKGLKDKELEVAKLMRELEGRDKAGSNK